MISIKNVNVKFDKKVIFNNFSCNFKKNKINVVIGRSGCGKTTLLRCIAGLQSYTGNITCNPKDVYMMHQHYTNFPWKTCLENVLFPIYIKRKPTKKDINEAILILNQIGLGEYINNYPMELSGGMNQRLAFARVLMAKPKIILMDEPMSALDDITKKMVEGLLLELHKKTNNTIIMITHHEDQAKRLGDEILNFNNLVKK